MKTIPKHEKNITRYINKKLFTQNIVVVAFIGSNFVPLGVLYFKLKKPTIIATRKPISTKPVNPIMFD